MAEGGDDLDLKDLGDAQGMMEDDDPNAARTAADLQAVFDIPVHVSAVLGKANMQVSPLLTLGRGAVVELDRQVREAIAIYVKTRLVEREMGRASCRERVDQYVSITQGATS